MPPSSNRFDASFGAPTFCDSQNSTPRSSLVSPARQRPSEYESRDGATFYNSQNSTVASAHRRSLNFVPPVLPVSPIKKQTANGTLRDRNSTSFTRRLDQFHRVPSEEIVDESEDMVQRENIILNKFRSASTDNEDLSPVVVNPSDLMAYGLCQELRKTCEMFKQANKARHRKVERSVLCTPKASFILKEIPETPVRPSSASFLETARHASPVVTRQPDPVAPPRNNQAVVERLVDLSLGRASQANVAPRKSFLSTMPIVLPPHPLRGVLNTPGTPPGVSSPNTLRCSPLRQDPLPVERKERTSGRGDVRALLRELNIDVDSIPHKGLLSSSQRHLNSAGVKAALGGRSQSLPRSRPQTASNIPKKSPPKISPKMPFCSTASKGNISQSIIANEQTLMKLVSDYFPHWRAYVRNLLADESVGDDVAYSFLKEIQHRKNISEMQMRMARLPLDDERRYEFNRVDQRILDKLDDQLKRHNPSRIQQLRILHKVLEEAAMMW